MNFIKYVKIFKGRVVGGCGRQCSGVARVETPGAKNEAAPPDGTWSDTRYRIEVSRGPGDVHELEAVLKRTFFLDEPSIRLLDLTGDERCGELLGVMLQGIALDESLVAKSNSTGEMVGFALNGQYDSEKFEEEVKRWTHLVQESRNKKLLHLWTAMSRQFDFRRVVPGSRAMEIYYLGVVPEARRRGLARELVRRSLALAATKGYGIVQVVCTSDRSAKVCRALGLTRACTVTYDSLAVPGDGRPVVTRPPPPPDHVVQIYFQITHPPNP